VLLKERRTTGPPLPVIDTLVCVSSPPDADRLFEIPLYQKSRMVTRNFREIWWSGRKFRENFGVWVLFGHQNFAEFSIIENFDINPGSFSCKGVKIILWSADRTPTDTSPRGRTPTD
jgi:hypothetical protein